MAYFVYILLSQKDNKLYVGCTSDVQKRVHRHETGQVASTRNRRPLVLIHQEEFQDKANAFNSERFLKSLWSASSKKQLVALYKQSMPE